jgi:hypothetical protein
MRVLDQLPPPIVVCPTTLSDVPVLLGDDYVGACALCGASVLTPPAWHSHCSPICLLCYLVHGAPDVPTC